MSLLAIVVKNLLRRPMRTLLTLVGITIGISAVVALTSLAWGFEATWVNVYRARGADLIVVRITSRDPLPAPFPETMMEGMAQMKGIRGAAGVLSDLMSIERVPTMLVAGWQLHTFVWDHLKLKHGRWLRNDMEKSVLVGEIAAELLHKSVGDTVQIDTEEFTVAGIFSSQSIGENGAVVLPLGQLQALTNHVGMLNFINLSLDAGATPEAVAAVRRTIEGGHRGFRVFDATEIGQANVAVQAGKAMSVATSVIALAIGAVGVMNTVLMSVFERVREIGVLLALGWRRSRIIRMIMFESMLLSMLGGVLGTVIGGLILQLLQHLPVVHGRLEMTVGLAPFGAALLVSLLLGALGGLYPAWRGAHMQPISALRYE
jgi:putative ABC transport system permease protein